MNNIIAFPCKARVASNDINPWLSAEPLPELAKDGPRPEPIYAKPCKVVDKLSGVEYDGYVIDERKTTNRVGLFVSAVIGWLLLFALV